MAMVDDLVLGPGHAHTELNVRNVMLNNLCMMACRKWGEGRGNQPLMSDVVSKNRHVYSG